MAITVTNTGTVNASSNGTITPVLPAHATNDILIATVIAWVPNTSTSINADGIPTPSGWTRANQSLINTGSQDDGAIAIFWKRATSGAETNPTFARGTTPTWDTGVDTCYAGRCYVVKGCTTSGDPWDAIASSGLQTAANASIPAVTVSGSNRRLIAFMAMTDDNVAGNPITATSAIDWSSVDTWTTTTGTDASFGVAISTHLYDSNSSSQVTTIAAPTAGRYVVWAASFIHDSTTFTPTVKRWRVYDDSWTALANENTAPTLTGAQNKDVPLHLRVQYQNLGSGTGSEATVSLQYSENQVTWVTIPAIDSGTKPWFRYDNGTGTPGNTIESARLTSTTESGVYVEAASASTGTIGNAALRELDYCFSSRYAPPDVPVYLRLYNGSAAIPLAGSLSRTNICINTPTAANWTDYQGTGGAIGRVFGASGGTDAENLSSGRQRLIYDGTYWWYFWIDATDLSTVNYRYWSGSGAWSSTSTRTIGAAATKQAAMEVCYANNAGTKYVFMVVGTSTTNARVHRGTISGTSISWDSEQSVTCTASQSGVLMGLECDTAGYVWLYGNSTTTLWAKRSTSAYSITAWQADKTSARTMSLGGLWCKIQAIGYGSDDLYMQWFEGTASITGDLYCVRVSDASGFGSVTQVNSSTNAFCNDWSVIRNSSDTYLYCFHSDASGSTGNADSGTGLLRRSTDGGATWADCTGSSGLTGDGASTDGWWVAEGGNGAMYCFITRGSGTSGNSSYISYKKYTGGLAGTWDVSATTLTGIDSGDPGSGNADNTYVANVGGNLIIAVREFGDDDQNESLSFGIFYGTLDATTLPRWDPRRVRAMQAVTRSSVW